MAWGALLALAGAAGRRVRLPREMGLVVLGLAVSLGPLAVGSVTFLRQVRAQWRMSPEERRAAFLDYQVGLDLAEIEEVRRLVPEDASMLVLQGWHRDAYTLQLVHYLLQPRRLYRWREGPPFALLDGRPVALPDRQWLEDRGIRWVLEVYGREGRRVRARHLP